LYRISKWANVELIKESVYKYGTKMSDTFQWLR
jgi:hypothetical protein